jgi:hypothetical protein
VSGNGGLRQEQAVRISVNRLNALLLPEHPGSELATTTQISFRVCPLQGRIRIRGICDMIFSSFFLLPVLLVMYAGRNWEPV